MQLLSRNPAHGSDFRLRCRRGPSFRACLIAFCGKQWPRYLFLGAIGFIIRLPAIQGGLIWDDVFLTRDNPFIKSPLLALEAFRHYLFLDSFSGHYRPVQNLSYMLDYFFWNTDPAGFHLSNILLHVAAGLLLYRLLTHLFGKQAGLWESDDPGSARVGALAAFVISGIWMVHPVHSAAIDYISGRADSLAFVFSAGAWLLVLRARIAKARWLKGITYLLAALGGVLALCSREIACIWILIFLVHTLAFARDIGKKAKITTILCCALVLGTYAELRRLPVARAEKGFTENWSAPVRGTLMLRALGDYGRLMVFPGNLHMERSIFDPGNYLSRESWRKTVASEYLSILGLAVLTAFIYGCARRGIGQRMRIMGTVWFFAAYLPISNIVQLNATVAEHWLYLPSVGFLLFLGGCALDLPRRFGTGLTAVAAIAILALSVRSAIRSSDWGNEENFYKRTIAAGGLSPRVGVNLAQIYARPWRICHSRKNASATFSKPTRTIRSRAIISLVFWRMKEKLPRAKPYCARSADTPSKRRISILAPGLLHSTCAHAFASERRCRSHCDPRAGTRGLSRDMGADQS